VIMVMNEEVPSVGEFSAYLRDLTGQGILAP
jgi:hypothetical protein